MIKINISKKPRRAESKINLNIKTYKFDTR